MSAARRLSHHFSISVFGYQVSALERMRVHARLALLAGMTEDEVVGSKFELSSTWLSDVDDSHDVVVHHFQSHPTFVKARKAFGTFRHNRTKLHFRI